MIYLGNQQQKVLFTEYHWLEVIVNKGYPALVLAEA